MDKTTCLGRQTYCSISIDDTKYQTLFTSIPKPSKTTATPIDPQPQRQGAIVSKTSITNTFDRVCEGIIVGYYKPDVQNLLRTYKEVCLPAPRINLKTIRKAGVEYVTAFANECDGKADQLRNVKGNRAMYVCGGCEKVPRPEKIKQNINKRVRLVTDARLAIKRNYVTDSDVKMLKQFNHIGDEYLTEEGIIFKARVKAELEFLRESNSNTVNIPSSEEYIRMFEKKYHEQENDRDKLMYGLLMAVHANTSGMKKFNFYPEVLNFFQVIHALSPRCFQFVSANLSGPALRTIQRHNAKEDRDCLLEPSSSDLQIFINKRLDNIVFPILESLTQRSILVSVAIDGTKCEKIATVSSKKKGVLGYAYPNHFLPINAVTTEIEMTNMLQGNYNGLPPLLSVLFSIESWQYTNFFIISGILLKTIPPK